MSSPQSDEDDVEEVEFVSVSLLLIYIKHQLLQIRSLDSYLLLLTFCVLILTGPTVRCHWGLMWHSPNKMCFMYCMAVADFSVMDKKINCILALGGSSQASIGMYWSAEWQRGWGIFIRGSHCKRLILTPLSLGVCVIIHLVDSRITEPLFLLQLDDKIACHKERVASTLDRLAQQVALEKKERAERCRAFKVRQL